MATKKEIVPLYAKATNMMEGLTDEEVKLYLELSPKIVSLFEIDVVGIIASQSRKR